MLLIFALNLFLSIPDVVFIMERENFWNVHTLRTGHAIPASGAADEAQLLVLSADPIEYCNLVLCEDVGLRMIGAFHVLDDLAHCAHTAEDY